jgi:hypothetical protein
MSLTALLMRLRSARVLIGSGGNGLYVRCRPRVLTSELKQAIRSHEAALLALPRPYLTPSGDLVVPLSAAPQYHWQPLVETLLEMDAGPDIISRYCRARR